jgi:acid phosphatase (class A)
MKTHFWRTGSALIPALLILSGCTAVAPTTSTAGLTGGRTDYVIGYLELSELPNSQSFLPPPPAAGSALFAGDEEIYKSTRKLRDTPRWLMAARDADLTFPNAAQNFACAAGIEISAEATPHLNMLLRRVRGDSSRANDAVKNVYKRQRPYISYGDTSCTPHEKHKDDSYPSGHTSIGWAMALVLAEVMPERADAIFARGLAFGESRVICGVHWQSDINAGRVVGAATVSRLHTNAVFLAQLKLARKEVEASKDKAQSRAQRDCAEEARALALASGK